MVAAFIIDQNDFLGTAVIIRDLEKFTNEDQNNFDLMSIWVELANFAIK